MSILNQTSIIYADNSLSVSGRTPIIAQVFCADAADLPAATYFDGYNLVCGSSAKLADGSEYGFDGTDWVYQAKSPFEDVYTKSETYSKSEVNDITDTIHADYTTADNEIWAYIWQLMVVSDLNLISVHSGASTGFFVENLPIDLPPGTYIWKMQRDGNTTTSMRVKAADDTSLYNVTRGAGVNDITQEFTLTGTGTKISIYTGAGVDVWDCLIFRKIV